MAMRNWWIVVEIDGRTTTLKGGPRSKEGGFTLTVYQRDKGESIPVVDVEGIALGGGRLKLKIDPRVTMMRHGDMSLYRTTDR